MDGGAICVPSAKIIFVQTSGHEPARFDGLPAGDECAALAVVKQRSESFADPIVIDPMLYCAPLLRTNCATRKTESSCCGSPENRQIRRLFLNPRVHGQDVERLRRCGAPIFIRFPALSSEMPAVPRGRLSCCTRAARAGTGHRRLRGHRSINGSPAIFAAQRFRQLARVSPVHGRRTVRDSDSARLYGQLLRNGLSSTSEKLATSRSGGASGGCSKSSSETCYRSALQCQYKLRAAFASPDLPAIRVGAEGLSPA